MAGLLIPSAASVLFNVLIEMLKSGARADIPNSAYDFALPCAFTIVGAAVVQTAQEKAKMIFTIFCMVLLALILTDLILRYKLTDHELFLIVLSDCIALVGTAWAIWE